MTMERVMSWSAAFLVGYVIGVSVAAVITFYWG